MCVDQLWSVFRVRKMLRAVHYIFTEIFIIGQNFVNENLLDIGLLQTVVCLKSIPHEKPRNAQRITF